jgi:hypothetical protein
MWAGSKDKDIAERVSIFLRLTEKIKWISQLVNEGDQYITKVFEWSIDTLTWHWELPFKVYWNCKKINGLICFV